MLRLRCTTLLFFAVLLAGCSRPGLLLDVRSSGSAAAELAPMVERYGQLADRLQAHAAFYEHEGRKNHTKMRMMGVLSVVGAGAAAGTTASAFNPDMPDTVRPAIASASISLSVLSAVFVLLPHAHQYILKEAGYQRMAEATRASYADLETQCGVTASPGDLAALRACVETAQDALLAARQFPLDSPCKPPPDRDLDRLLRSAGRAP